MDRYTKTCRADWYRREKKKPNMRIKPNLSQLVDVVILLEAWLRLRLLKLGLLRLRMLRLLRLLRLQQQAASSKQQQEFRTKPKTP